MSRDYEVMTHSLVDTEARRTVPNARRRGFAPRKSGEVGLPSGVPTTAAPGRSSVLLIGGSPRLHDEVARVAAAAAVDLIRVDSVPAAAAALAGATAVLVASEYAAQATVLGRRLVAVGLSDSSVEFDPSLTGSARLWREASSAGIDRVAALPEGAEWLAGYLGRLQDPAALGPVVGVVGGCGGAGASTLAVLLASWAARRDVRTLLVDGDEWGGGLELALAEDPVEGLRWADLSGARGDLNPAQLAAALPVYAGFSLLSWGAAARESESPPASALGARDSAAGPLDQGREVLVAARRGYELTVVDLGRTSQALTSLGQFCDHLVLVVPAKIRPAVASMQFRLQLPLVPLSLVVRGPVREGLDAELIGQALNIPFLGTFPWRRGLATAIETGRLTERGGDRKVGQLCDALMARLGGGP